MFITPTKLPKLSNYIVDRVPEPKIEPVVETELAEEWDVQAEHESHGWAELANQEEEKKNGSSRESCIPKI